MSKKPINKHRLAKQKAEIEFRYFKKIATEEITKIRSESRFQELERVYNAYEDYTRDRAIQINFGSIPIDHLKDEKTFVEEKGGCLVYSMGTDGRVGVFLYPAKSDFQTPFEDNIILRFGHFSGWQLRNFLRHDIKDMVSYTAVTATFGEATFRENLRIWWLRRTHPLTTGGNYHKPSMFTYAGKAAEFTFRQMILALLKPFALILALGVFAYFGWTDLISFLSGDK